MQVTDVIPSTLGNSMNDVATWGEHDIGKSKTNGEERMSWSSLRESQRPDGTTTYAEDRPSKRRSGQR